MVIWRREDIWASLHVGFRTTFISVEWQAAWWERTFFPELTSQMTTVCIVNLVISQNPSPELFQALTNCCGLGLLQTLCWVHGLGLCPSNIWGGGAACGRLSQSASRHSLEEQETRVMANALPLQKEGLPGYMSSVVPALTAAVGQPTPEEKLI